MRTLIPGLALFILFSAFTSERREIYPYVKNESFTKGEVIHFKMNYGIFTIGRGSTRIHDDYFTINGRQCFKVDVFGKTVGLVDWVADVDDQFGAYIDTAAIVPHMSYRKIREGRYRKDEIVTFDHVAGKIETKEFNQRTGKYKTPKEYDAPASQVRDLIAGFMFMRTQDFSELKVNDTIMISGFFEDTFYNMKVLYKGKAVVKTKAGKIRTIVLKPMMPNNKLFDGENSVTAWFSDDKNRIPVKISADMFIGSAGVELTSYSGLKNPINIVK
jgi:hypothetical protein